jgi:hypothetical protein
MLYSAVHAVVLGKVGLSVVQPRHVQRLAGVADVVGEHAGPPHCMASGLTTGRVRLAKSSCIAPPSAAVSAGSSHTHSVPESPGRELIPSSWSGRGPIMSSAI